MAVVRSPREAFAHFLPLATRWMDNDVYGHVNNVQYYSYFDTAVNHYLITSGWLDIHNGDVVGLVVETRCSYAASVAFPDELDVGLRVEKLGNSSVRYGIGIFRRGEPLAAAEGHFIHVYVDRQTNTPVRVPDALRAVLQPLLREEGAR
ncbi:MAG TPA: thioesterase family protein [Moraxellaceae bacterium]|nr:thioesterase family protein [Moraxellaceae bacterium]